MAEVDSQTLACTYASLILHDEGLSINAEGINKLIQASGVEVENFWPGMFAKALDGADISELCSKIGSGAAAPAAAAAAPAAAAAGGAAPAAKKAKEPEPEEDADMGFSLFD